MTWLLAGRVAFGRLLPVVSVACVVAACYQAGSGTAPPPNTLYFPVGLDTSRGGNVLYVANSDFDLQYNGGTIQSYDLNAIRKDVLIAIKDPTQLDKDKLVRPAQTPGQPAGNPCVDGAPVYRTDGTGQRQPLGETCAPPVKSEAYFKQSVTIGAFATDLQVLRCEEPPALVTNADKTVTDTRFSRETSCSAAGTRLFVPVRGDASVTWATISVDDPARPAVSDSAFQIDCGAATNGGHCTAGHNAGNSGNEPGNTRLITMPGEPFGMAQSQDGQALVVTHQTDTKASLFTSGLGATASTSPPSTPAIEYVLDGLPIGGNGIFSIPHDRALTCLDGSCNTPRPAYLWTTRAAPEVHVLRYYSDDGSSAASGAPATLHRPFLLDEARYAVTASSAGTDSRGLVIDRSPRLACKAKVRAQVKPNDPTFAAKMQACARTPARVFIANRSPAALLVGQLGGAADDGSYDADRFVLQGNVPLSSGPSKVYLAPIVDQDGNYALRVFIVCFDSATLFIYDPDAQAVEASFRTAPGPFAMAFDPFDLEDVAVRAHVVFDERNPGSGLLRYRFAYLASFTESFIQVIDLDNSRTDKSTFELPVFTLGSPTLPKGAQ
jgi:hypothetical protein